jgi:hypothetical protein
MKEVARLSISFTTLTTAAVSLRRSGGTLNGTLLNRFPRIEPADGRYQSRRPAQQAVRLTAVAPTSPSIACRRKGHHIAYPNGGCGHTSRARLSPLQEPGRGGSGYSHCQGMLQGFLGVFSAD